MRRAMTELQGKADGALVNRIARDCSTGNVADGSAAVPASHPPTPQLPLWPRTHQADMTSRTQADTNTASSEHASDTPLRPAGRALPFALLLFIAWSAIFAFLSPPDLVRVQVGEPSPRNIKAPRRMVYISDVRTEEARNAAVARVADVYTSPDMNIALNQLQALKRP